MAKMNINANTIVIASVANLEDIKMLSKYAPESLILRDDDDKPIFMATTGDGCGSISKTGCVFGNQPNAEGKACVSMVWCGEVKDGEDLKTSLADKYGEALLKLEKLEATLPNAVANAKSNCDRVAEMITVG